MKIGIIGYGNMGRALYKLLSAKFDIYVCDRDEEQMKEINTEKKSMDANDIINKSDIIILAVKPQMFEKLAKQINVSIENKIILSIMAGVKIDKIIIEMKSERVIRSMPNLATHVGKSMTGWFATKGINENDKENIKQILELIGHEVEVQEEKMLDDITAISGSGPAYFFYLCELLQEKAQEFDFSKEQAKILAEETSIGSALVLNTREKEVKEWREAVSSKKGATEVAIKYLEDKQFGEIFKGAIDKAKKRFEEV